MMVTTKTTVTFHIPNEYAVAQRFVAQHPDWIEHCGTGYVGYTKQDTYAVAVKEEGEQEWSQLAHTFLPY